MTAETAGTPAARAALQEQQDRDAATTAEPTVPQPRPARPTPQERPTTADAAPDGQKDRTSIPKPARRLGVCERRELVVGVTPFRGARPPAGAARLVVGVERGGGLGVLDLGRDREAGLAALAEVTRWWKGSFGVRIPAGCGVQAHELPDAVDTVLADAPGLAEAKAFLRPDRRLLVEVVDAAEAQVAVRLGAAGLIARGCEAGGRVGDLTTFVLLQRLTADPEITVPIWAAGGIGLHTAAAAVAGGACGVVLDAQLALVSEMELPGDVAAAIAAMDGGETTVVAGHRVYGTRRGRGTGALPAADPARMGTAGLGVETLPVGQEGAFAAPLAATYKTAGGVIQAVRHHIGEHIAAAVRSAPLAPESHETGRRYPVAQGPMTRVSDRALFAAAVAQEGGLPFLALALMSGDEVRELLTDTAERLGDLPWGVGLLGFAPPELREAQLAAVAELRPRYALIAGGRPGQAVPLQKAGITTFLHVPSPGLLERFLEEGSRHFVFEGFECGGHVGPRAAFPLWEAQLQVLTAHARKHGAEDLSVMFAGGIHDERSAAMVAALAGPLAERGADVKLLMGTSYLFTHEAVAAGAILPGFQKAALECGKTVLLETSPGHATRCADTPYVTAFEKERTRLEAAGADRRQMWAELEERNLGRLRIASKGLRREGGGLQKADEEEQLRDGMYMIGQVASLRSTTTSVLALHEQVSAGATGFLAERATELGIGQARDRSAGRPLDIAIVGVGCVFPGARDAEEYWANVVGGVNAITEVPEQRWDPELFWDPESSSGEKTPSKWGGFLPDIPFDALAYGIPPTTLGSVEPIQLLALEVATRALADAGYAGRPFDRSRTSVVFGAEGGTDLGGAYSMRSQLPMYFGEIPDGLDEQLPKLTEDSFTGVLTNMIASRIANRLDLGGAAYTVDAACAASLAALDAACKELASGSSDMVLCGGADTHNGIHDYLLFSSVQVLSPNGRCAAFDNGADGIVLGEGVGCVVLKRLADAERDGDRIYAVIKAVAGASDGRSLGLTAPRPEGQRRALDRAYRAAGISPAEVGLVEAHGTGTAVGDRTELDTLTQAFTEHGAAPGGCALGSVKSQIGHTKCAAGMAGLIKAALAVHHGVRPGTVHLQTPVPSWEEGTSPFAFDKVTRPWATTPGRRYAGISSFGLGGVDFHAVLAGYEGAPEPVSGLADWPAELFLVRGGDRAAALRELDRLDALAARGMPRLRDLARTAAAATGPVQVAIVADDLADLRDKLAGAREFRSAPGIFPAPAAASSNPAAEASDASGKVAFLFPGQGSQRPGMLADLFVALPRLQRLLHLAGTRCTDAMFPPAAFSTAEAERRTAALTDTALAQPALGVAGLTMCRILEAVGVRPDMAAGHSYGELVALCAAGVYGERDLIALSTARAQAILAAVGRGADPGTMAAVAATEDEVRAVLAGQRVAIAGYNAPREVVISGPTRVVDRAVAMLAGRGISAQRLPVACAFHSPLVAKAADRLRTELDRRDIRPPAFPVWSNTSATPYPAEPEVIRAALAGQVAAPVRFAAQIEAMYEAGARIFVEAGPGRSLSGLVGKVLGDRPHTAVACDRPGDNGVRRLLLALAELAAAGVTVDVLPLFAGRGAVALTETAEAHPGWLVNGRFVRTVDGEYVANALRPARRLALAAPGSRSEETVLEYLRSTRELVAAQREVVLGYLGGSGAPARLAPASPGEPELVLPAGAVPAPREASAPQALVVASVIPAEEAGPEPAPEEIRTAVLSVISARTGYPSDMLGGHLDLEADLSIDSIKRTEIVGELAGRVGLSTKGAALDESLAAQLAKLKTIGEIVGWLTDHLTTTRLTEPSEAHDPDEVATLEQPAVVEPITAPPRRHVVLIDEAPPIGAPEPAPDMFGGRRYVIVDDGSGIALELAVLLEQQGATVTTPVEPDGEPVDGLIHLGALRPGGGAVLPGAYAGIRAALLGGAQTLLLATGAGGGFGHGFDGSGAGDPSPGAGLRGLARTLALEFPDVLVRAVDVDTKDSPRLLAERLFAELLTPDGPVDVGYEGTARRTLAVRPAQEDWATESAELPLTPDSVVLLTGGARGITARVAVALAHEVGCHVELLGRTPPPTVPEAPAIAAARTEAELRQVLVGQGGRSPGEIARQLRRIQRTREIRNTLAELSGPAASVRYHSADMRDASAVRAVLQDIYARHGRLDGVIHGAGMLDDRLVREKDPDSFSRVFRTKVHGAVALAAALRPEVGFFVVFGSVAGVYGNRGQADYAAANDACDTLARVWRTRLRGKVLVVDWGPWAGGGMISAELAGEYARRGVTLLDPDAAVAALLREIALGADVQVVLK